jgi:hypothetical protein
MTYQHPGKFSCEIPIFLSDLNELEFSRLIFLKPSPIIFYVKPFSGRRLVYSGRTDRQTDMMKLIIAFRIFAKSPKMNQMLSRQ